MSKLQFRKPDELELDIGRAMARSLQPTRKEILPHEAALDSDKIAEIEASKDPVGMRSMVQEKGLDRPNLTSKYARVMCCSFEQEIGN
jgi:DNA topoisomerase VI subunit B